MDIVVTIVAWVQLVLNVGYFVFAPPKPAEELLDRVIHQASRVLGLAMAVVLVGRCLGWW